MSEFNESEYKKEYDRKTYKRMTFRMKRAEAEETGQFIRENTDMTQNQFILEAVREKIASLKK